MEMTKCILDLMDLIQRIKCSLNNYVHITIHDLNRYNPFLHHLLHHQWWNRRVMILSFDHGVERIMGMDTVHQIQICDRRKCGETVPLIPELEEVHDRLHPNFITLRCMENRERIQ